MATAMTTNLANELKQWMIGTDAPGLVLPKSRFEESPERSYNLKGSKIQRFLQHERQTFGINLGWTDDEEPATARKVARWFLARSGSNADPIRYGEAVAIGNGGKPSFLRYAHREVGINLDWSNTPVFEWRLLGGESGQPVPTGERLAIYNERAEGDDSRGECLIHFDRTAGGDIGWPSSKTWTDQLVGALTGQLKREVLRALGL